MTNNSTTISISQISISGDSDSESSWNHHTNFSHFPHLSSLPPPPPTTWEENLPLTTPPSKKPRGRPPGSKNKPKYGMPQPPMKILIVNVAPGHDIIETILDIARRDHVSLTILSASGSITTVTLRHVPTGSSAVMLHGPFNLLSLTGSYLYNNHPGATPPPSLSFGIHLSTSNGRVFGGLVGGRVLAGNHVNLTVSTFKNPEIYKYVPQGIQGNHHHDDTINNNNNKTCNHDSNNFNTSGDLSMFNGASFGIRGGE